MLEIPHWQIIILTSHPLISFVFYKFIKTFLYYAQNRVWDLVYQERCCDVAHLRCNAHQMTHAVAKCLAIKGCLVFKLWLASWWGWALSWALSWYTEGLPHSAAQCWTTCSSVSPHAPLLLTLFCVDEILSMQFESHLQHESYFYFLNC